MAPSPHILLVEDDRQISRLVAKYLDANDCRVTVAGDGREMDRLLGCSRVDLILLDVMLPGEDGLSLCLRLRRDLQVPIIMLTAKSEDVDRILGLEVGADDYLPKPFNPRELLARIRAVLRRAAADAPISRGARMLRFLGFELSCVSRELRDPGGACIDVTGAEFDLLRVLCERPARILSREQLLDLTQGRRAGPSERSVDILISRLRRKIEADPQRPDIIKTVRAAGYLFTPQVEAT
jgi:two-component system OmpR family response regulator